MTKVEFKKDDSVETIMKKAGLTWEVRHVPCFMDVDGKKVQITRKALIRDDNNKLLTVTGEKWKPVPNKDVISFFKQVTDEAGARITDLGVVKGGKGIWMQADIGAGFELKGGDKIDGSVLFCSYHEVGKSSIACTTAKRLWCSNQIAFASRKSTNVYRQSHIKDFDFSAAKSAIGAAKEEVVTFSKQAEKLSKMKMSEQEAHTFLARQFVDDVSDEQIALLLKNEEEQPLALKQVLHSYVKAPGASPGNAWGVLNAVTHWADHVSGTKEATRFDRAMFGDNARLKMNVMEELLAKAA